MKTETAPFRPHPAQPSGQDSARAQPEVCGGTHVRLFADGGDGAGVVAALLWAGDEVELFVQWGDRAVLARRSGSGVL